MPARYNNYAYNRNELKSYVNIISAYQSSLEAPFFNLYNNKNDLTCALLTFAGAGKITLNDNSSITLSNNTLYFQEIKEVKSFSVDEGNWSFICIWFNYYDIDIPIGKKFNIQSTTKDVDISNQIIEYMREPGICGISLANATFLKRLMQWLQIINQKSIENNLDDAINRVLEYIDEHIEEDISIDQLAKISSYSKKHFRHLFEKKVGMLPKKYLLVKRMNHVAFLLISTNLPVSKIADQCHFSSPYNMSLSFKNYFNASPYAFRKANEMFIFNE